MKLSELLLGQLISERSQFIQTAEAKMDNESDKELQQLNKSTEMVVHAQYTCILIHNSL